MFGAFLLLLLLLLMVVVLVLVLVCVVGVLEVLGSLRRKKKVVRSINERVCFSFLPAV